MICCPRCPHKKELHKSQRSSWSCILCRPNRRCSACSGSIVGRKEAWSCKLCGYIACELCAATSIDAAMKSVPGPRSVAATKRPACRYGAMCYNSATDHVARFAHPGDRDFRYGSITLGKGQRADLRTLWDIFCYFDPEESGHMFKDAFMLAAQEVASLSQEYVDVGVAWSEARGSDHGQVSFVRFAIWCAGVGLRLPVGLDTIAGSRRCCRFTSAEGRICGCQDCTASAANSDERCRCGHRSHLHRSEAAQQTLQMQLLTSRPAHWMPSGIGLVRMTDAAVLSQLQFLLDATHLETDNWTRDRGCALHGVNRCANDCIFANRARVPTGYRLVAAWRNQNPALWARYSLMRATIGQQCSKKPCTPVNVESSLPAFDTLDSTNLARNINEFRLFHGSSHNACKDICENNFSLSLAGSGATWKVPGSSAGTSLYGPGFYLAERITKADEYTQSASGPTGDPVHCVLLCRALGGRVCVCEDNEIDPEALRRQVFNGPYHVVLGDRVAKLRKPYREVVMYDRDQLYPEFLLTYTRLFAPAG